MPKIKFPFNYEMRSKVYTLNNDTLEPFMGMSLVEIVDSDGNRGVTETQMSYDGIHMGKTIEYVNYSTAKKTSFMNGQCMYSDYGRTINKTDEIKEMIASLNYIGLVKLPWVKEGEFHAFKMMTTMTQDSPGGILLSYFCPKTLELKFS